MAESMIKTATSAVRIIREHFNKDFDLLILYVTDLCNAKCDHCFYSKSLNKNRQMSLEDIGKISSKLPAFRSLNLTGGEPFLRKDIAEIARMFYRDNQVRDIWIPSNGIIDPSPRVLEMLQSCPELSVTVNFSIDDLREKHDLIRGVPCFDKAVENSKNLMALKMRYPNLKDRLRICVNTVIHSQNFSGMESISLFIKTLGVDYHSFELMRGDPKNPKLRPLTPEEFKEYQRISIETETHYMTYSRLGSWYAKRYREMFYKNQEHSLKGEPWNTDCTAGITSAVIYADGEVGVCELLGPIGNIKDNGHDLPAMLGSEKAMKLKKFIKDTRCRCTHCVFLSNTMRHSLKCL